MAIQITILFKSRWKGASDIGFVDVESGNEEELQHAIASQGPCSIAIDASHESFQFYSTGLYREPECDPGMLDHGVLLVGYGQEEDGSKYWLVKNSWGEDWAKGGHSRLKVADCTWGNIQCEMYDVKCKADRR